MADPKPTSENGPWWAKIVNTSPALGLVALVLVGCYYLLQPIFTGLASCVGRV